jgi:phospholipase D1/2
MTNKHISQLVSKDGKAAATATSAPGCFIHDGVPVEKHTNMSWGNAFSEPCSGNKVDFYVTGEEYFAAVAEAIAGAKNSIYIAGWQVNFDVELVAGTTLFQYLEKAIDTNPSLRVFVMPWLSPKVGVDTGDFETMLAVFQLNAGHPPPARAFALPAIAQSDMPGGLGIGFSHHQKLVVIDDQRAFVGGIDLAYGRRDDGRFSLAANGRTGNELYNSCIPPVHELSKAEQVNYLTRAELLCACFDGKAGDTATFFTSASEKHLAVMQDLANSASDSLKKKQKEISDWWATADLLPEFMRRLQDVPIDAAQDLSRWAYRRLDQELQGKLERLRQTGSAHAANAAAVLLAWLNNASMEQLPAELRSVSIQLIETFVIATLSHLSYSAGTRKERYANLRKLGKIVPASGKVISSGQPRMPWHDVHSSISGPVVSDLSRNFVRRWNGIAHRYEKSYAGITTGNEVRALFTMLGLKPILGIRLPRLSDSTLRKDQPKTGKCWMQVLRSAPRTMQRDEANAERSTGAKSLGADREQNNCLKAMLTAIHGAQKFIYIEGQFFQSAYGIDHPPLTRTGPSGPMASLIDLTSLASYETYTKRLGIYGVTLEEIPGAIRWSQVDDVRRDANGKGASFLTDLDVVLKNLVAIKASKLMGKSQDTVCNAIGEAIARRIETAIYDGLPFHVYMVLPVHPEGTLNTLNIMTQLHLTMQSLVFGSESLVNRIRRAMLVEQMRREKKISRVEALETIKCYDVDRVVQEGRDHWKKYLTLLNLRNWQILEKRAVTEQIYVHSKLLIADDRVAILGSANINDRSQLGNRDSELAVVVRDDEKINVKLDGQHQDIVSLSVYNLRVRLWRKLFGLMGSAHPASSLSDVVDKPAARETWEAIQRVAYSNALAYQSAFPFLAKVQGKPSSIWPTWDKEKRCLKYYMPFNERFWRGDDVMDNPLSWDAKSRAPENSAVGVQGFIVALPISWTDGENNVSGMNLSMLANNDLEKEEGKMLASKDKDEGSDIREVS